MKKLTILIALLALVACGGSPKKSQKSLAPSTPTTDTTISEKLQIDPDLKEKYCKIKKKKKTKYLSDSECHKKIEEAKNDNSQIEGNAKQEQNSAKVCYQIIKHTRPTYFEEKVPTNKTSGKDIVCEKVPEILNLIYKFEDKSETRYLEVSFNETGQYSCTINKTVYSLIKTKKSTTTRYIEDSQCTFGNMVQPNLRDCEYNGKTADGRVDTTCPFGRGKKRSFVQTIYNQKTGECIVEMESAYTDPWSIDQLNDILNKSCRMSREQVKDNGHRNIPTVWKLVSDKQELEVFNGLKNMF
ncbi:MAG: hypothetical protein FWF97_01685 [Alphaproteobacteria bacterium]|nr:hypothetical protein [Alphaproteobacteria bacterium]